MYELYIKIVNTTVLVDSLLFTIDNSYHNNSVKLFTSPYLVVVCVEFSSLYIHRAMYNRHGTMQYVLVNSCEYLQRCERNMF